MLRAPLKAGESPKATPVMIPTHTSKAPAAAVEKSFKSWFTQSNPFPKGLLRVSRELLAVRRTTNPSLYLPKCVESEFSEVRAWHLQLAS
jgi:hypothetical protein